MPSSLVALRTCPIRTQLISLKRNVKSCPFASSCSHIRQTHNRHCYYCRAELCVVQQRLERQAVPLRICAAKDKLLGENGCN